MRKSYRSLRSSRSLASKRDSNFKTEASNILLNRRFSKDDEIIEASIKKIITAKTDLRYNEDITDLRSDLDSIVPSSLQSEYEEYRKHR